LKTPLPTLPLELHFRVIPSLLLRNGTFANGKRETGDGTLAKRDFRETGLLQTGNGETGNRENGRREKRN